MTQRGWNKRRNCQWNCIYSFEYVIDHASNRFFLYVNSLHCSMWFLLYYLLHFLSSDCFAALTSLKACKFLIWIYDFFKRLSTKFFAMKTLKIWKIVSQRNLKTEKARECIFRVSGGTNVCTVLPKKTNWYVTEWLVCKCLILSITKKVISYLLVLRQKPFIRL